jgi:hypothetical protein
MDEMAGVMDHTWNARYGWHQTFMDDTAHFVDETAHFIDLNRHFRSYGWKHHFMDETAKVEEKQNIIQQD